MQSPEDVLDLGALRLTQFEILSFLMTSKKLAITFQLTKARSDGKAEKAITVMAKMSEKKTPVKSKGELNRKNKNRTH